MTRYKTSREGIACFAQRRPLPPKHRVTYDSHSTHTGRRAAERAGRAWHRRCHSRSSAPRARRRPARLRVMCGRVLKPVRWRPIRAVSLPDGCAIFSFRLARAATVDALPRSPPVACSARVYLIRDLLHLMRVRTPCAPVRGPWWSDSFELNGCHSRAGGNPGVVGHLEASLDSRPRIGVEGRLFAGVTNRLPIISKMLLCQPSRGSRHG